MTELTSRNVAPETVAFLAARLTPGAGRVMVFDSRREIVLDGVFGEGAMLVLDADCDPPDHFPGPNPDHFVVRLSTSAATRLDLAEAFAGAVVARWPGVAACRGDLITAVQEAVGNAVMHGNLGLDGRLRRTARDMAAFGAAMSARLDDPLFARRPVLLRAECPFSAEVTVSVEDVGAGFDPDRLAGCGDGPQGRGIAVIRACCREVSFSRGGRQVSMRFGLGAGS